MELEKYKDHLEKKNLKILKMPSWIDSTYYEKGIEIRLY